MRKAEELFDRIGAISENVEKVGLAVVTISPGSNRLAFAYTVGMEKTWLQPEILVSGLPSSVSQQLLNDCALMAGKGEQLVDGRKIDDLLSNGYCCVLKEITRENIENLFGLARAYYGHSEFRAMQLVWPDKNNRLPWAVDCKSADSQDLFFDVTEQ